MKNNYVQIHSASKAVTQEHCRNYVRHMERHLGDCVNRNDILNLLEVIKLLLCSSFSQKNCVSNFLSFEFVN